MFPVLKAEESFLADCGLNQHAAPVGRGPRGRVSLCNISRTHKEGTWQEGAYGNVSESINMYA